MEDGRWKMEDGKWKIEAHYQPPRFPASLQEAKGVPLPSPRVADPGLESVIPLGCADERLGSTFDIRYAPTSAMLRTTLGNAHFSSSVRRRRRAGFQA